MDKTIVVQITRKYPHVKYKKYIKKTKKYYVHDYNNECNPGDLIRIVESKPLSKLKRWKVDKIEKRAIEN